MSQDVDEYAEQIGQFKAGHGKFHAQGAPPFPTPPAAALNTGTHHRVTAQNRQLDGAIECIVSQ